MRLTLSILRCPDRVAPETRQFAGGEVVIGRGPGADWVLADPSAKPTLSRRHCTVTFRAGAWVLVDTSTNGTRLNGEALPEGGHSRALRDGDRLGIGPYEIEAQMAAAMPGDFQAGGGFGAAAFGAAPVEAAPFGTAPFGGEAGASPFGPENEPFGGGMAAGSVRLPDDFAADLLAPAPARPAAQPNHTPAFSDAIAPPMPRVVLPTSWDSDEAPAATPPLVAPTEAVSPFAMPPGPDPAAQLAAPPAVTGEDGGLAAFLAGAGMAGARPADPPGVMRGAGAAFRAFVQGLRRVLMARAEVKSAFRIDQTMVRTRGNNPLKFAVSDEDALSALLGTGRRTDMSAAEAVDGALNDIRLHELATMAAMQDAISALLDQLDPAKFSAAAEGGILPAAKRARAFDLYETEYRKLRAAFSEKFDDAFGRAFARAYERVIADLQAANLQDREALH